MKDTVVTINPETATGHVTRSRRYLIPGMLCAVILALLVSGIVWARAMQVPDVDQSTSVRSVNGHFQVTILPSEDPVPVNRLHSWVVRVESPEGIAIPGAEVTVDGDMPQHLHGMPTVPQVTGEVAAGDYLVEGMKFQMGGWWVIDVTIIVDGREDTAQFNIVL